MYTEAKSYDKPYRNLYGGTFDPAQGYKTAKIDTSQILLSLLFFDQIIVPDNFFFVYGPLYRHFQLLQSQSNLDNSIVDNDVIIKMINSELIVPALRKHKTLFDLWHDGSSVGIHPGQMINVTKEEGDKLVDLIAPYERTYSAWPDDMAEATTTRFGDMIYEYLSNPDSSMYITFPEVPETLGMAARAKPLGLVEIQYIRRTIDDFHAFVGDNKSRPKFRRGEIENFVAGKAGKEKFSYDLFNMSSARSLTDVLLTFIIHQVSTVYELYQASSFNLSAQLYSFHDPFLPIAALTPSFLQTASDPQVYFVDLCADINPNMLNGDVVAGLRKNLMNRGENLFEEQIEKRTQMMALMSVDAVVDFVEFCRTKYIPAILRYAPELKSKPIASGLQQSRKVSGNIGGAMSVLGIVLGQLAVTVVPMVGETVSAISTALSTMGITVADRLMSRIAPIDRLSNMRRSKRAWAAFIERQNNFGTHSDMGTNC